MPVTVQWIGVAAAVIAGGMGLGHLYVEVTAPPQVPSVVERQRVPKEDPAVAPAEEDWFERPEATPAEVAARPARASVPSTPVPAPDKPSPVADRVVVYRPVPVVQNPPEPVVHEVNFVQAEPRMSLEERLRSSLGDPQELTDPSPVEQGPDQAGFPTETERPTDSERPAESSAEETSSSTEAAPSDPPRQAEPPLPGPPDSVGGVAVLSLQWNGRDLEADVREDPQINVTLVTIRGDGGPNEGTGARPGRAHAGAQQERHEAAATAPGIYYFRFFVGSTADSIDPDSHGLLGKDLRVLPSGGSRPRVGRGTRSDSMGGFGLASAVGLDPVWLPDWSEGARSEFVAAAGRKLYDVTVAGKRAEFDSWHEMHIGLSHRYSDRRGTKMVELDVLVRQDRFVVFRVSDLLLAGKVSDSFASVADTALVAFTPFSGAAAESIRTTESRFEQDPTGELIVIEGPPPVIPVEFLYDPAVLGDLRLRVLVYSSGELGSVVAIGTALPRGEYLVEPVVSAVRQWRFHPPPISPREMGAYFDITVGPDGEMTPYTVE